MQLKFHNSVLPFVELMSQATGIDLLHHSISISVDVIERTCVFGIDYVNTKLNISLLTTNW